LIYDATGAVSPVKNPGHTTGSQSVWPLQSIQAKALWYVIDGDGESPNDETKLVRTQGDCAKLGNVA
jgi:hypothetical protein